MAKGQNRNQVVTEAPADGAAEVTPTEAPAGEALPAEVTPTEAPADGAEKVTPPADGAEKVTPAAKPTVNEKRGGMAEAVAARDIQGAFEAIKLMGGPGGRSGLDLFGRLTGEASQVFMPDPLDPTGWDLANMGLVAAYKVAVLALVSEHYTVAEAEAADPTTGPLMSLVRATINQERARRVTAEALTKLIGAGVTAEAATERLSAFLTSHAVTDLGAASADQLTAAFKQARGGERTSTGERAPYPNDGRNGADGWATGRGASHVREAAIQLGDGATLRAIQKAFTPTYPEKTADGATAPRPSESAIANAFHRGIQGFVVTRVPGVADGAPNADAWCISAVPAEAPVSTPTEAPAAS